MKTIQENALRAVHLAVQEQDNLLGLSLKKFIDEGTFESPPVGRGQTTIRTFKPGKPLDTPLERAILESLENMKKALMGRIKMYNDMTIDGAINSWKYFISK